FRETGEDKVPKRPIAAAGRTLGLLRQGQPLRQRLSVLFLDYPNRKRYLDFGEYQAELRDEKECPEGVDTRELPVDCLESANTPDVLFEKLSQWGFESL